MVLKFSNNTKFKEALKDTPEAFRDFFKKQAIQVYEVMCFDMQKYVYSESIFDTLYIEIKDKC